MARNATIPGLALADRRLNTRDISVLAAIALHGSKACPSAERLGEILGIHRVNVQKSITRLRKAGYLTVRLRFKTDGSQTSSQFAIPMDLKPTKNHRHDCYHMAKKSKRCSNIATPPCSATPYTGGVPTALHESYIDSAGEVAGEKPQDGKAHTEIHEPIRAYGNVIPFARKGG